MIYQGTPSWKNDLFVDPLKHAPLKHKTIRRAKGSCAQTDVLCPSDAAPRWKCWDSLAREQRARHKPSQTKPQRKHSAHMLHGHCQRNKNPWFSLTQHWSLSKLGDLGRNLNANGRYDGRQRGGKSHPPPITNQCHLFGRASPIQPCHGSVVSSFSTHISKQRNRSDSCGGEELALKLVPTPLEPETWAPSWISKKMRFVWSGREQETAVVSGMRPLLWSNLNWGRKV